MSDTIHSAKPPRLSAVEMTEVVLPNDANPLGNMLGGRLLHLIDMAAAVAAIRHAGRPCVTASFDSVDFLTPVHVGEACILKAKVTWVGRTSLEVAVDAYAENMLTGQRRHTTTAFTTFVAIDPGKRTVKTRGGASIGYDRLVLAPGIDVLTDSIRGYQEAEAAGKVVHAWKAGPQTALLRKQLEAMPDGGTFVMSIPATPYRCPPGPYERICMVAHYFKQAKPKSRIIVLDSNADIVSKKPLFTDAWNTFYPGMIEYRSSNAPTAVDGGKMTVSTDLDEVRADVMNVIPRQRAGSLTALAGARNDSGGNWCTVNLATFESTTVPNVHVIGDSVLSSLPKSGHMATNMAKVCAAAIVEVLAGRQPDAMPVIANTCYSATSGNTSGYVANVWRYDTAKGYVSQPEGGATPRGDAANFVFNESWAKNIWAEMLS